MAGPQGGGAGGRGEPHSGTQCNCVHATRVVIRRLGCQPEGAAATLNSPAPSLGPLQVFPGFAGARVMYGPAGEVHGVQVRRRGADEKVGTRGGPGRVSPARWRLKRPARGHSCPPASHPLASLPCPSLQTNDFGVAKDGRRKESFQLGMALTGGRLAGGELTGPGLAGACCPASQQFAQSWSADA